MAATLEAVPSTKTLEKLTEKSEAEAARELVRMAKEQGLALTGPDGLLKQLTKTVIETALDEELTASHYPSDEDTHDGARNPPNRQARRPGGWRLTRCESINRAVASSETSFGTFSRRSNAGCAASASDLISHRTADLSNSPWPYARKH